MHTATNQMGLIGIKNQEGERERQDRALDDQFIAHLRRLINDYMKHTKRPFPIKYFLDFTDI